MYIKCKNIPVLHPSSSVSPILGSKDEILQSSNQNLRKIENIFKFVLFTKGHKNHADFRIVLQWSILQISQLL